MGDEEDRLLHAALQVEQLVLHFTADQRIEGTEGFVHEEDVRVGRQGARQADALLHAAAELFRVGVLPSLEADQLQGLFGFLAPLFLADLLNLEAVFGVLSHGAVGEEGETLEDHAELGQAQLAQLFLGELGDIDAIHLDRSVGRFDQSVDAAQQGRLAAARQTHDDEEFSFLDLEGGLVDADGELVFLPEVIFGNALFEQGDPGARVLAEYLGEIFDLDLCCHNFRSSS